MLWPLALHQYINGLKHAKALLQLCTNRIQGFKRGGEHQGAPAQSLRTITCQLRYRCAVRGLLCGLREILWHIQHRLVRVVERTLHLKHLRIAQPAGFCKPAQIVVIAQGGGGKHPCFL